MENCILSTEHKKNIDCSCIFNGIGRLGVIIVFFCVLLLLYNFTFCLSRFIFDFYFQWTLKTEKKMRAEKSQNEQKHELMQKVLYNPHLANKIEKTT